MSIALSGFIMGLSLIIAIGPQNALILRQGVKGDPVLPILVVCLLSDVLLILGGTAGVGVLVDKAPLLLTALKWFGFAYLLYFAWTCFRDARRPQQLSVKEEAEPVNASAITTSAAASTTTTSVTTATRTSSSVQTKQAAASWHGPVLAALAFTWLNPAAYIDALVMLGGIANQYGNFYRWFFAAGALLASGVWFPTLGFGARKLSGPLSTPAMWQRLNVVIGCLMVFLAVRLAMH